ncbi:hypothetical protein TWF751_004316 [Orbilia oligospora]|nr:hypothetical protein TWF751_004316 [Orbilia oligospora]
MHSHPQPLSTSSPHMPIGLELEPHYDHLASPEFLSFERAGSKAWEAYSCFGLECHAVQCMYQTTMIMIMTEDLFIVIVAILGPSSSS